MEKVAEWMITAWNKIDIEIIKKSFKGKGSVPSRALLIPHFLKLFLIISMSILFQAVKKSFKKCGISNALDGTEDDMLW